MIILECKSIFKSYSTDNGALKILRGVEMAISKGEIVSLMGPSGSGKSTLLNILGTLDAPDSGEVLVREQRVSKMNDEEISRFRNQHIGFVFQFHHLLPEFTLLENLEIPMQIYRRNRSTGRSDILELLEIVGLSNRRSHYPAQLSGGERQRVAVVRALVNQPDIVLADEPTGNLDAENSTILMELIGRLRRELEQTFLIATHNRQVAGSADRTLFLHSGCVLPATEVEDGSRRR